jgi:hypothetical protein
MLEVTDNILTNLRASNNKIFGDTIRDVYAQYVNTNRLDQLFKETEKHMTTKKVDTMLCKDLFPRGAGFKEVVDALTSVGNSHLQSVASIHSRMTEVEETVKEIAEIVNTKEITRQQLDMLSKIARVWATYFDRFATVINDVYRIDHNVTLNIVQIRKYIEI